MGDVKAYAAPVGVGTGEPDLWCTYAAVRTLTWLGRVDAVSDRDGVQRYLTGRRNGDGGYAWSRGMASDAWATYYCTQALAGLGEPVPRPAATAAWLRRTFSGEAYAMTPGQTPDVWATHFSTRTVTATCGEAVPDQAALTGWLRSLQCADGGLCWTPADAECGNVDVRACYYGVHSWVAVAAPDEAPPWDVPKLVAWLRRQQDPAGGFRFAETADVPCLWATYRAVGALIALGAAPRDPAAAIAWVLRMRGATGAFVRWQDYPVEDVWASFCAVGTLRALAAPLATVSGPVVRRLRTMSCPGGGYTYRELPLTGDALTTSARILVGGSDPARAHALRRWLEGCQLPNEGGVMYMPGRGSEVRCTLWALTAGAFATDPDGRYRIARWIGDLQNPDGGFGYWQGRASDLVSTVSALEILRLLGVDPVRGVDADRLRRFVRSCAKDAGHANVPGAEPTLRAGMQARRLLAAVGDLDPAPTSALLDAHRVPGGGYANEGARLPDLLSTYEAVLTSDRTGVRVDGAHVARFLTSVDRGTGTAWTPLAPDGGGPLADCLGDLLRARLSGGHYPLPPLALS